MVSGGAGGGATVTTRKRHGHSHHCPFCLQRLALVARCTATWTATSSTVASERSALVSGTNQTAQLSKRRRSGHHWPLCRQRLTCGQQLQFRSPHMNKCSCSRPCRLHCFLPFGAPPHSPSLLPSCSLSLSSVKVGQRLESVQSLRCGGGTSPFWNLHELCCGGAGWCSCASWTSPFWNLRQRLELCCASSPFWICCVNFALLLTLL